MDVGLGFLWLILDRVLEANCLSQLHYLARVVARTSQHLGELAMIPIHHRRDSDRFTICRDGVLQVAFLKQQLAEFTAARGSLGINRGSLTIRRDCAGRSSVIQHKRATSQWMRASLGLHPSGRVMGRSSVP